MTPWAQPVGHDRLQTWKAGGTMALTIHRLVSLVHKAKDSRCLPRDDRGAESLLLLLGSYRACSDAKEAVSHEPSQVLVSLLPKPQTKNLIATQRLFFVKQL